MLQMVKTFDGDIDPSAVEQPSVDLPTTTTTVDLKDIEPYADNARLLRNPKWNELEASILASGGLTDPLPVTRRPGDTSLTICQGGNTRLAILKKLHAQTGDPRFSRVCVTIKPFTSELDLAALHERENLCRGGMTFFEQAWGKFRQYELFRQEKGGKATARAFIAHMRDQYGDGTTVEDFSRMKYAVEVLYQHIPTCLVQGAMSQRAIRQLISVKTGLEKAWCARKVGSKAEFQAAFFELLGRQDKNLAETFLPENAQTASTPDKRIAIDWQQFEMDFCHECTIARDHIDFFQAKAWVAPVLQSIAAVSPSEPFSSSRPSPALLIRSATSSEKAAPDVATLRAKAYRLAQTIAIAGGFGESIDATPSAGVGYRLITPPLPPSSSPEGALCWWALRLCVDGEVEGDPTGRVGGADRLSITNLGPDLMLVWANLLNVTARLLRSTSAPQPGNRAATLPSRNHH